MTTFDNTVRQIFHFTLTALIFLSAAAASASSNYCSNAPLIGLDETLRAEGRQAGEPDCYRLQTPAAGLLMLDLAVPGAATAEPRIGLLGSRAARIDVIERSAAHLLVSSDGPRELTVCAGAEDPREALGEFKLRTTFLELDTLGGYKVEQAEADPDPFAGGCANKVEQAEADPDPFAGCTDKVEQAEADPDPFAGGCGYKVEQAEADPDPFAGGCDKVEQAEADPDPFTVMCQSRDLDDHSDSRFCATAVKLGHAAYGEIDNGFGDDHDVFAFKLASARTVRIETAGDVDAFGGLYDRRGQRLATAGEGGDGANFRLVKTLEPGLYFVRIEGSEWSNGAYALDIDTVDRAW